MATLIARNVRAVKNVTTSLSNPGATAGLFLGVYTNGLTTTNSVSISSRVKQLFNALRDGNQISWQDVYVPAVYATVDIDGGIPVIEETYVPLTVGQVRIGIGEVARAIGSGILERAVIEMYDWGNENDVLING